MYLLGVFFRLLKVGTKVNQCTSFGVVVAAAPVGERQSTAAPFLALADRIRNVPFFGRLG
jgi:hypothetical protein